MYFFEYNLLKYLVLNILSLSSGVAGGWRGKLTPQQDQLLDQYVQDHFQDVDIPFQY